MNTLRKRLGLDHSQPQAKSPPPAKPQRTLPVEADRRVIITRSCGHKIGVVHLQGSSCPHCARKARRERRLTQTVARRDRANRLPDGATFCATYDAQAERWAGTLTIGGQVFEAEASGVFRLMEALDRLYRASRP
jgi:hypothetical protein